jgi:hypothetical protein
MSDQIYSQERANCPHKLTKTAEPWLGGGAAFGRLRTARGRHVGCSSLPPLHVSRGSRRAAQGGRNGRRLLQLRVSTLARPIYNTWAKDSVSRGCDGMRNGPTPVEPRRPPYVSRRKRKSFRMLLVVCYRLTVEQDFDVLAEIVAIEVIAIGRRIRDLRKLVESYGDGRWRKLKGVATVRLHSNGRVRQAELHWYEAHGIGKRDLKIKRYID